MDQQKIAAYAEELFMAERNRAAVPPLSDRESTMTVDDAYQIQLANIRRVSAMGHVISGKKIGLTSPGIQKQFGVNEPDYGHLFAAMDCTDGRIHTGDLLKPKIEGEIAFVLKADLSGGAITREDVLRATDYVVAAFEIVDSRVADWKIKLVDTIADNASSGRYVLGTVKLRLGDVELPSVTMRLYKNGSLAGEGSGAAVLGDPCLSVAWLANRLWGYGVTLKAGEVILSGAFSAAPEAVKGDSFTAEFSSFGTIGAEFV
ncbi:MAG: fumarylacetoacetate hydrolase family protein [Spirochaetaceae bacterium]|jgi:2-keto-4-pentenoate hydratase|nr:fumarylacetoacetate hydrolase family protein [Spirochaetaceae bacterium]